MHEEINNAFSRPWFFYMMRQNGIIGTDLRKAVLQKYPNISSGIKCFVEDDSASDRIERFLIETGADETRGDSRLKNRRGCDRFAQESENQLLSRLVMTFIQSVYDNKIGTLWKG